MTDQSLQRALDELAGFLTSLNADDRRGGARLLYNEGWLLVSVLLTFCMWSHTFIQNFCRRVVRRQRLIYYKGRSTF